MSLLYPLIFLLLGSGMAPLLSRLEARWRHWLLPVPAGVAFVLLVLQGERLLATGNPLMVTIPWVPYLDLSIALQLTGLGLLMGLLITGIGTLILLYASSYMDGKPQTGRFYAILYAFMFAMTGLVLSDHLLLLFVFWELTSITSYLLIGYNHRDAETRRNALQALLVTGLGGLALMAGIILIRQATGTWLLSELTASSQSLTEHGLYGAILVLVLIGAFTKSAQFPFHFWLPNAMAAPTPVSAYLHSATMVKAGIYLLAVMLPILGGTQAWTLSLTTAGSITLLLGGVSGLKQHDLKRILAGTTLAVLGLLTLLLGIGTEKAVLAAVLFLLGHALYKATLFMIAGVIDHETGTRDTRILGGLARAMPWTAGIAALAALSKMGLPPLFGFIGKEYVYKASLSTAYGAALTVVLVIGNALILALAYKAAIRPFFGKAKAALPRPPHEAPWPMLAGPLLLALSGLLAGLDPAATHDLVNAAKSSVLGYPAVADVKLWSGLNLPLVASGCTVFIGLVLIISHGRLAAALERLNWPGAGQAYEAILNGVLKFGYILTRFLQSGYLRNYLLIIIGATTLLVGGKLLRFGGPELPAISGAGSPSLWAVAILMLFGIAFSITTRSRLTALIALGLVGFGMAFIFALFSAPDLAITQVLVETLTVALFAWVIHKLPGFTEFSSRRARIFDAALAITVGILVSLMVLTSKALEIGPTISGTLARWSLTEAYGANVVNVILVDFRALDTWGEVTVLAIAALGVWALLPKRKTKTGKLNP